MIKPDLGPEELAPLEDLIPFAAGMRHAAKALSSYVIKVLLNGMLAPEELSDFDG